MFAGAPGIFSKIALTAPARHGRGIGRAQQDQPLCCFKMKGERDQQCHGHGRRQTRRCPKDQPTDRSSQQQTKIDRCEHITKIVDKLHADPSPNDQPQTC